MKKITELQDPNTDYTPLQQDNDPGINDLMSLDDTSKADNVRLSQAQKFILTKLMLPNNTDLMSYEQVSNGRNIVANRQTLEKLGMLSVGENTATITDKGKAALSQEGLMDETGVLSQQGEQYAYAADLEAVGEIAAQQKNQLQTPEEPNLSPAEPPRDKPMGDTATPMPDTGTPALEAWHMIVDMQRQLSETDFIRKYSKKS